MEKFNREVPEVNIYTKENCMPCRATVMKFGQLGIAFSQMSIESVPEKMQEFIERGYLTAPIVETEDETWSGFRPDKLNNLIDKRGEVS